MSRTSKRPHIDPDTPAVASTSAVTLDNHPADMDPMRIDYVCSLLVPVHAFSFSPSPELTALSTSIRTPPMGNENPLGTTSSGRGLTLHLSFLSSIASSLIASVLFPSLRAFVFSFLFVLLFLYPVNAIDAPLSPTLGTRTLSLNSNGLGNPMKVAAIGEMVMRVKPQVIVIGETKNVHEVHHRLALCNYDFFESPACPTPSSTGKYGVVVGVRHGLLHANRVEVPETLSGRAVAVDLVIPTTTGQGFIHRLVGVYADTPLARLPTEIDFSNALRAVRHTTTISEHQTRHLDRTNTRS
jgi:hypothetical protein